MFTPYQPRSIACFGLEALFGFALKVYSIHYDDQAFNRARFDGGWKLVGEALPKPCVTSERPGVGFAIMHQGRTGDYLVLGWWDRENELPLRVFIRDENGWRATQGSESVCVWDLKVIWRERSAYVDSYLNAQCTAPLEEYCRCIR